VHIRYSSWFGLAAIALACSGTSTVPPTSTSGGASAVGGTSNGATSTGGTITSGGSLGDTGGTSPASQTGGIAASGGQSPATGGNGATGGSKAVGGSTASAGGSRTGGTTATGGSLAIGGATSAGGGTLATGGAATGGKSAAGGTATGGKSATGGASAGGAQTGGTQATGGSVATGGTSAAGGGSSCPFPTSFKWKDNGGPIAQPGNGWVSLKDFTNVVSNGQHIIYSSMHDNSNYGSQMMVFKDWPDAATATQTKLSTSTVAPTLFYFTPKQQWILAYQWCSAKFCYATSTDPTKATSWSFGHTLLSENVTGSSSTGPIDQTVICDSTNCYLFYADDNGHIYRASMPIGNFPGTFSGSTTILTDTAANLFEAVQVYAVKGTGQYLMIVEAQGSGRYFRAFSATSLGGTFTAISGASSQSAPFAGKSNVTFTGTAWTNDISHGDLVRENPDETFTVDPCSMQLLYQGRDPNQNPSYDLLPYRPGLLTKTN
jgi:endo-1,4-beta-xylanase